MSTKIQKGKSVLRPRARLIRTIGDELISSDIVAILELVKNSYDADADIIEIKFEGKVIEKEEGRKKKRVLIKEGSSISITDDGVGMSLTVVKEGWMEPATIIKKYKDTTPEKVRRYTGEKGIGRFASSKLAQKLEMVTKAVDDNEVVAVFDWTEFSNDTKYLDQIKCKWEVRSPKSIKKRGTILNLQGLNSDWDEEKLRTLRVTLSRLINPIVPIPDFLMELILPKELEDLAGDIEPPESLSKPRYSIEGTINNSGEATIIYRSVNISKPEIFRVNMRKEIRPVRDIKTGPFSFIFYVWDRDNESLKELSRSIGSTVTNIRSDLNALSGVSVYRDYFRVLPYGEPKNDWLRLDLRRVQNPTMRVSNNQIIGFISISLSDNPEFKDQSNREGLVESQALSDLRDSIKVILNLLEVRRYVERRRDETEIDKLSLFANFAVNKYLQVITNKHPNDKEVIEAVEKTEASINEGVKKVQEVLAQYRRLSTLGLLIDSVLHDGNHYLSLIDGESLLLEKELINKSDKDSVLILLRNIRKYRELFSKRLKILEPFSGRKRGRPKEVIIEEVINNIFELQSTDIERLKITTHLPESKNIVRIDEGDLETIIVNLLINSIYWLETITDERIIIVEVEKLDHSVSIIFSDNGPGVKEENYKAIFEPYFSTKAEGIGMGLTIVGEIITEYDGEFYLIDNGPLEGATFKITFKERV